MYALPQMQPSLVSWWQDIKQYLNAHNIEFDVDLENIEIDLYGHWLDSALFFSQTCGYPLTTVLKENVKLIGTPVYDTQYCRQTDYCSLFIVRSTDSRKLIEDYRGSRFTYNGNDSQSGFNAVKTFLREQSIDHPFFAENIMSGQHINSIANVANLQADICAVDCVTHALLQRHQPEKLANTRVLATTKLTPGLPFITSINTPDEIVQVIFDAINHTCANDKQGTINTDLLLNGVKKVSLETYMHMINPTSTLVDKL